MPEPLIINESKLLMHFQNSGSILTDAVDSSTQVRVQGEFNNSPVIGGLFGTQCEYIRRNRGRPGYVAPLLELDHGIWVWIGYHEEWDEERRHRNTRRYSFRSAGLSIHFGFKYSVLKPQIFRAEWAGWAKWSGPNYGFQAACAGHPHWQFDTLDSLSDDDLSHRVANLLSRLKDEAGPEIHDFSPQVSDDDVHDIIAAQNFSRMHFASAAAWWKSPPPNGHIHAPNKPADVEDWVRYSIDYIKLELGRL